MEDEKADIIDEMVEMNKKKGKGKKKNNDAKMSETVVTEEAATVENVEIIDGVEEAEEVEENSRKAYNELLDRYQRSLAEFDNFRKRTLKEKAASYDMGVQDAVEKLLPTLDNFERALVAVEDKEDNFYKGIEMIARQLDGYLNSLGVEAIGGEVFDHNLHYAVAHVEDPEYGQGAIIEELQKGYTYKGKVIRPSMVRVAN